MTDGFEAFAAPPLPTLELPFLLVSRARRSAGFNFWTHNLPELMKNLGGDWATLHPSAAARLGIAAGQVVRIATSTGEMAIEATIPTDVREGVVAVQQFWGHHYDSSTRTSRNTQGVNVNLVHDDRTLDRFCGMSVFHGRACRVEPA